MSTKGRVVALYVRPERQAPVRAVSSIETTVEHGVEGDHYRKRGRRQVTILGLEDWRAACEEVGAELDPGARRANVVIEGIKPSDAFGRVLRIGTTLIEIIGEVTPCHRMDEAHEGLKAALAKDVRCGVFGRIVLPGTIEVGASVEILEPG